MGAEDTHCEHTKGQMYILWRSRHHILSRPWRNRHSKMDTVSKVSALVGVVHVQRSVLYCSNLWLIIYFLLKRCIRSIYKTSSVVYHKTDIMEQQCDYFAGSFTMLCINIILLILLCDKFSDRSHRHETEASLGRLKREVNRLQIEVNERNVR